MTASEHCFPTLRKEKYQHYNSRIIKFLQEIFTHFLYFFYISFWTWTLWIGLIIMKLIHEGAWLFPHFLYSFGSKFGLIKWYGELIINIILKSFIHCEQPCSTYTTRCLQRLCKHQYRHHSGSQHNYLPNKLRTECKKLLQISFILATS